ncbi:MAG: hypothetical protein IJS28_11170 [Synergistaceae bacterium]|nr:hypothetical protein [Synergistaceae bacterium]
MHRKSFCSFMLCLLVVFTVIASQGCGGSSSTDGGGNNGSVVVGGDTIFENEGFDTDDDGKPDFLDFDEVTIRYVQASSSPASINVSAPTILVFEELKSLDVGEPDAVSVNLQAGTEYTIEFSRNLTDPIESLLPVIEILDPVSKEPLPYFFSDGALPGDRIQISAYPEEKPSLVCLTFRPSVSGEYVIKVSGLYLTADESEDAASGDSTDEFYSMIVDAIGQDEADSLDSTYGDSSSESSPAEAPDNSCVLFIYKELRNERGEPGYYTRFKFKDDYGNTTDTADIDDVIELRRLYLALRPDYLKKYYGENPSHDRPEELTDEEIEEVLEWLYIMQEYSGLTADDDADVSSASTVRAAAGNNLNSGRSAISSTLSDLPYDSAYGLGSGFFGVTGYQARGHALQGFTLPVPGTKRVTSNYKADFVSSQQEQEQFSKTTADASFSKGGFGLDASISHMSSYKYGLTSTTLVIHYDERETEPRLLDMSAYQLTEAASAQLEQGSTNFRNLYGDYFVAGYVYGGTYDAFISITTETTEQLKEVKSQLGVKFQSLNEQGPQASAKIANETKDILNKYKASVSVEIRTSGSDASDPDAKVISPSKGKNNVEAIGNVVAELFRFRSALSKQSPAQFAPVSVVLKRYSLLDAVLDKMNREGDDGTIPIAPDTAVLILSFNRSLMTLGGYYQVIAGLDNTKMDASIRNAYNDRYRNIIATVTSDPDFYGNSSKVSQTKSAMDTLAAELKATGDRYVFYRMLMTAQDKEHKAYNDYNAKEDDAGDDDTHHQPFGSNGGGSTGFKEFFVSAAVTEDIQAGKSATLDGRQSYKAAGRRYWGTSDHNMQNVDPSYTAYTSSGGSDAAFCYVSVQAENKSDRHRRFQNYPVAGKSELDFDFTSGYSRDATWLVKYQTMHFTREKYPFFGLSR